MAPYYLLIAGLGGIALVSGGRVSRRPAIVVAVLVLVLMSGLRSVTVGTDTLGYLAQYRTQYVRENELGFSYLVQVSNALGLSFQAFLFLAAIAVNAAVGFAVSRYSDMPLLSIYLHVTMGLFAMSMSGLRQSVAVAVGIAAILLLMRGHRIAFVLLVLGAYTIHNSAIALLPLVLVSRLQLTRRRGALLLVLGAVVATQSALAERVLEWRGLSKYTVYLEETTATVNPLVIAVAFIIPLACLVFWPRRIAHGDTGAIGDAVRTGTGVDPYSFLFTLAVVNFTLVGLSSDIPIMTRFSFYFVTFAAILIANTVATIPNVNVRLLAVVAVALLPLTLFVLSTPGSSLGVAPYSAFWSDS